MAIRNNLEEVTEVDISNKTMTFQIGRKITTVAIKNVEVVARNKMVDLKTRQITTGILGVIMVVEMMIAGGKMLCLNILMNLMTIGPMVERVFRNKEITMIQEETEVPENSRKNLEIMTVATDAFSLVILQENVQMKI